MIPCCVLLMLCCCMDAASPMWTLHFQYCTDVVVRNTHVFNANNGSIEAPNGDGIDVHSSTNVHVYDSIFDVGDDALCWYALHHCITDGFCMAETRECWHAQNAARVAQTTLGVKSAFQHVMLFSSVLKFATVTALHSAPRHLVE